jgi:hypothetical protein
VGPEGPLLPDEPPPIPGLDIEGLEADPPPALPLGPLPPEPVDDPRPGPGLDMEFPPGAPSEEPDEGSRAGGLPIAGPLEVLPLSMRPVLPVLMPDCPGPLLPAPMPAPLPDGLPSLRVASAPLEPGDCAPVPWAEASKTAPPTTSAATAAAHANPGARMAERTVFMVGLLACA